MHDSITNISSGNNDGFLYLTECDFSDQFLKRFMYLNFAFFC